MSALYYSISCSPKPPHNPSTKSLHLGMLQIGVRRAEGERADFIVPPSLPRLGSPATPTDLHAVFGLKVIGLVFAGFTGEVPTCPKPRGMESKMGNSEVNVEGPRDITALRDHRKHDHLRNGSTA